MKNTPRIVLTFVASFMTALAFAQIPNSGFENWTSMGNYNNPTGWDNLNGMCNTTSGYCAVEGTPGNPGSYYLKLTSQSVLHMGTMPGMVVSGVLNQMNMKPQSGFAFTDQPISLTGSWQYMSAGSGDMGYVSVFLSKWNSAMGRRDTISYTKQTLSGMVMSWTAFAINLNYKNTASPDSAIIVLSASGLNPVAGSYLYVDNLAFVGIATGTQEATRNTVISVYPNPAENDLTIETEQTENTIESITVYNLLGQKQVEQLNSGNLLNMTLHIGQLPVGHYMLQVKTKAGIAYTRFVKQ